MHTDFAIHTLTTAPQGARPALLQATRAFGSIPNLLGVMAESPALVSGYLAVAGAFRESSFAPLEQHVVLQTVNRVNDCAYCTAAHSAEALRVLKIDPSIDAALRELRPLDDPRLEALRTFVVKVVAERGRVGARSTQALLAAGYTKAQALEVVLGVAMKTLSNYVNHLTSTPLDAALEPHRLNEVA